MKLIKVSVIIIALVNIISCSKEDVSCNAEGTLSIAGKTFTHEIQGCERPENSEINCSEFFIFKNGEEASGLVGGSDIVLPFNYFFKDKNTVFVHRPNTSLEYTFTVIHPDTLLDISNNEKWVSE